MILYYLLAAVLIAIDQLVKWGIVQNFALYDELEVIPNIFSLYYIQNRGAAWGDIAREDGPLLHHHRPGGGVSGLHLP